MKLRMTTFILSPYEPVDGYITTPKNIKGIKYIIVVLIWLPMTMNTDRAEFGFSLF